MAERVFVDTSLLLHAHDRDAGVKQAIAEHVLRQLWADKAGTLSVQVLEEFYLQFTRAIDTPAGRRTAREIIEAYSVWPVAVLDVADTLAACDHSERFQVSLRNATILVAARKLRADVLLSESPHHGWNVGGLEIRNPFL